MKCRSCGETLTKKTHEIPSYFGFLLLNLYNLFRNDMVLFGKNNASKVIVSVIKKNNIPVKSNL
jgi:hypothetical protein